MPGGVLFSNLNGQQLETYDLERSMSLFLIIIKLSFYTLPGAQHSYGPVWVLTKNDIRKSFKPNQQYFI